MFRNVIPRFGPKYFRFGLAISEGTGTTNRRSLLGGIAGMLLLLLVVAFVFLIQATSAHHQWWQWLGVAVPVVIVAVMLARAWRRRRGRRVVTSTAEVAAGPFWLHARVHGDMASLAVEDDEQAAAAAHAALAGGPGRSMAVAGQRTAAVRCWRRGRCAAPGPCQRPVRVTAPSRGRVVAGASAGRTARREVGVGDDVRAQRSVGALEPWPVAIEPVAPALGERPAVVGLGVLPFGL